jgi:hypothetical protein
MVSFGGGKWASMVVLAERYVPALRWVAAIPAVLTASG